MPNIIGMTEAEAVRTMHAKGLTPRVAYEDGGKKEGTVIRSETSAGRNWNTDASIFIYVQRKEKPVTVPPVKKETDKTVDVAPVKPAPEKPTKPVETSKPEETSTPVNDSSVTEEPSDPLSIESE
ncbi:beta-lactam-binding protein with PASTA domain [Cytobacillus eiseniae]|uniref:Beta-lactam-binding protein with PASTA domain n=1 Tax=Cytobacillus eiseniae TaxID=762947 RepID=A0ABS4RH69_9BACI|nr:PASTA domain-containing protein [Cytobacillus eiseniae]MBP2242240.1 beta-lactam-binding protein with PASTA domain [Cytobacillus eiseniae]